MSDPAVISLVVAAATAYLSLFVGLKLAKLEKSVLDAVEAKYARNDTTSHALDEIRADVAEVRKQMAEIGGKGRCSATTKRAR